MKNNSPNLRVIAANIINEVTDGRSLSDSIDAPLTAIKDPRDRAFVRAVCFGVCRFYTRLDVLLSFLLKKPMKADDSDLHALLLAGLYQLMDMRVPPHAAVDETVKATEKLNKPWARGLVNAVLREFLRSREKLEEQLGEDPEAHYAHPQWWIEKIQAAWPDQWEAILKANNAHPPFSLRVNQQRITRENYLAKVAGQMIPETQSGIILDTPVPAEELPGFFAGEVSVQDGAGQLAPGLLSLQPNQRVLDACAAPGGKLSHIMETVPNSTMIAVEKDRKRIGAINENLSRLKIGGVKVVCADVMQTKQWWDGQLFDRILLDAPCSASGVVRRHPDIKLLRQPTDINMLAREQSQLLHALWPLLKPGGLFVYATCSIFPEENVEVMREFLAEHADAREVKINASWGIACETGRQILTGMHNMDGFYYACLGKLE